VQHCNGSDISKPGFVRTIPAVKSNENIRSFFTMSPLCLGLQIVAPLTERRDVAVQHRKTEVEILAKQTSRHVFRYGPVGRGDDPHVEAGVLRVAQSAHLARFQKPEQMSLHRERDVTDLVEKKRATMRPLDDARLVADGASERPLPMAEELGLEQRIGDTGAVQRHQWMVPSPARPVNSLRD